MKLRQYLSKLSVVVCLTCLAIVATATPLFAQILVGVGEGGNWNAENVGDLDPLQLQALYSEARNAGHLISVWRGATNNQVWMSRDNGVPFTIGGTVTFESPAVAPFGSDSFMVFHTGDDGNIWYAQVFGDGTHDNTWTAVPGNFTNLPVSVAQMGTNSNNLFLVYRGLGNDLRVWGTWYDGQTGTWAAADNISGGLANNAPGVSMNNATNQLIVTAQGTNNHLWMTHQALGASSWNGWSDMGVTTVNSPYSAACADGNMVVSIINSNLTASFAKFDGFGDQESGWAEDSEQEPFSSGVQLTANGDSVFALTNFNGNGLWRGSIYNCN
jgi:hypothetical protein